MFKKILAQVAGSETQQYLHVWPDTGEWTERNHTQPTHAVTITWRLLETMSVH